MQAVVPALTNDLAPDHLRGRVNAAASGTFMAGAVLGPLVAGQLLGHGQPAAFIGVVLLTLVLCGWLTRQIELRVTPEVNGLGTTATARPDLPTQPAQPVPPTAPPGSGQPTSTPH